MTHPQHHLPSILEDVSLQELSFIDGNKVGMDKLGLAGDRACPYYSSH